MANIPLMELSPTNSQIDIPPFIATSSVLSDDDDEKKEYADDDPSVIPDVPEATAKMDYEVMQKFLKKQSCIDLNDNDSKEEAERIEEENDDDNFTQEVEEVRFDRPFFIKSKRFENGEYVDDKIQRQHLQFFKNKKGNKRVMFFDGKIRNISNISLKNQTFDASLRMYIMWLADIDDVNTWLKAKKEKKKDWESKWKPSMTLQNEKPSATENKVRQIQATTMKLTVPGDYQWLPSALGDEKDEKNEKLKYDPRRCVFVRAMYEFGGTFLEEFELQSYPFDCQDLKIIIRVKNCKKIVPIPSNIVFLSYNPNLSTLSDFKVMTVVGEFGQSSTDTSRGGIRYGNIALVVKVYRDWKSILNILIASATLTFLTLAVFGLEPSQHLGDRLTYLMTLILTDVSLQQSVASTLAEIEYLTALDKFIWSAFLFKVLVTIWVVVPSYPIFNLAVFQDQAETDRVATFVFVVLYMLWIASTAIYFFVVRHVEWRKLDKTIIEIQKEFLEVFAPFELEWDNRTLKEFRQKMREVKSVTRYTQFANKNGKELGRSESEQYTKPHEEVQTDSVILEKVSIRSMILFLTAIGLTTFLLLWRSGLWDEFRFHVALIYATNIVSGFVDLIIVCCKGAKTQYIHMTGMRASMIAVGMMNLILGNLSPRAFITNIMMMTWEFSNILWECYYMIKWARDGIELEKHQEKLKTDLTKYREFEKQQEMNAFLQKKFERKLAKIEEDILKLEKERVKLKTKHVEVYNGFYDENENKNGEGNCIRIGCDFSRIQLFLREVMKRVGISFALGFRAVIAILPVFVVQHKDPLIPVNKLWTPTDYIGIAICGFAFICFVLCVWHQDVLSVIDPSRKAIVSEARQNLASPTHDERRLTSLHGASQFMEETRYIEDPHTTCCTCCCSVVTNPFLWVRFPFRTTDFFFTTGLWVLTIVIIPTFVGGMVAILAPVFAFVLPYILETPLLDHAMDDAYGEQLDYRTYKQHTGVLFPLWADHDTQEFWNLKLTKALLLEDKELVEMCLVMGADWERISKESDEITRNIMRPKWMKDDNGTTKPDEDATEDENQERPISATRPILSGGDSARMI